MGWVKGILELIELIGLVVDLARRAKREGWINDGKELVHKIKGSSDEQKRDLARALSKHIRRM